MDGWYFSNWGEETPYCVGSCEFSWDLFREAYLGINPTDNCVEAPLDCAFYEIFKNCGQKGNCGGLSLLALAVLTDSALAVRFAAAIGAAGALAFGVFFATVLWRVRRAKPPAAAGAATAA